MHLQFDRRSSSFILEGVASPVASPISRTEKDADISRLIEFIRNLGRDTTPDWSLYDDAAWRLNYN